MNLLFKIKLSALFLCVTMPLPLRGETPAKTNNPKPIVSHKKKALKPVSGPMSSAVIKVNLNWQIIRSQGQGSKMGTSADTFSVGAQLVQQELNQWVLKIGALAVDVSYVRNQLGGDGVIYIEREDLLNLLKVNVRNIEGVSDSEPASVAARAGSVQLFLSKNQNRQQETIYRSPEEELFLVKASASLVM